MLHVTGNRWIMRKRWLRLAILAVLFTTGLSALSAQDDFKSGPAVGKNLPGSFQAVNLTAPLGKDPKDRLGHLHCLVCEFQLNPVVVTFIRIEPDGIDKNIEEYLKAMDRAVDRNYKINFLRSFVVFLTPHAKSSATEPKIEDPDKIIKDIKERDALADSLILEAQKRVKLEKRLGDLIKETALKHVVLTYMAGEGPKGFNLSPKPGTTVWCIRN